MKIHLNKKGNRYMAHVQINENNFHEEVEAASGLVLLDFYATWCGPCRSIAPILEELAKEYEGQIVIYKVDVDKEKGLAQAFNVSSIPAVLYIPLEGEPVMTVGARGKERFKEEIGRLLLQK